MHIDNHRVITASWGQSQGDNALFVQGRWGGGGYREELGQYDLSGSRDVRV